MAKNQLRKMSLVAAATLGAIIFLSGCGCGPKEETAAGMTGTSSKPEAKATGDVTIDGSTTVFPIVNAMGEDFAKDNSGAKIVVNKSGTGSGFQKFERGEIDIATASRAIKADEVEALKKANIDFIEIPIAYDGVSVIVPPSNTWADKLTVDELKKAWGPDSTVKLWSDIRPSFPKEKITFYGPTDNHGTYEYFTEAINGKKNAIRKQDYQANQDYNAIVSSVAGDKGGIGYVGFNYFIENKDKVKAVAIDDGKDGGVLPSEDTIAKGTYVPLSRPLFLYVSKKSMEKDSVKKFIDFALNAGIGAVSEAKYVQLPADALGAVKKHVTDMKTGSVFMDAKPGMTIGEVLAKENSAK